MVVQDEIDAVVVSNAMAGQLLQGQTCLLWSTLAISLHEFSCCRRHRCT